MPCLGKSLFLLQFFDGHDRCFAESLGFELFFRDFVAQEREVFLHLRHFGRNHVQSQRLDNGLQFAYRYGFQFFDKSAFAGRHAG